MRSYIFEIITLQKIMMKLVFLTFFTFYLILFHSLLKCCVIYDQMVCRVTTKMHELNNKPRVQIIIFKHSLFVVCSCCLPSIYAFEWWVYATQSSIIFLCVLYQCYCHFLTYCENFVGYKVLLKHYINDYCT